MKTLTIFTPTYNRAHTLPHLYASLKRQNSNDFIWLIVDDGSTDKTEILINSWIKDSLFKIIYIKQPNGGKMRAHNRGVMECNTKLFVCVDSDDYLQDDAVECIINKWNDTPFDNTIAGIISYRAMVNSKDEINIVKPFPYLENTKLYNLYINGFKGETTLIIRTSILKKYLFPTFIGEKFIPETYIYDLIDESYNWVLLDKALTICKYLHDGMTQNILSLYLQNPNGVSLFFNSHSVLPNLPLKERILYTMLYIKYSMIAGNKKPYRKSKQKFYIYIISLFFYYIYQLKGRI